MAFTTDVHLASVNRNNTKTQQTRRAPVLKVGSGQGEPPCYLLSVQPELARAK